MTREEAKQNLVALGIEEPTDAQVTNYLNQFHSNRPTPAKKPDPATDPEPSPQSATDPEPQNEEEIEKLKNQVKELQKENIRKDIRAYAAEKGLTGEQAEKVLAGFQENYDLAKTAIDSMSQIISDKETAAAQAKEQEIARGTNNPGGGTGGGNKQKTDAEKTAETIGKELSGANKSAESIVESYL
jgi:hypothetical protein|nr:MAG TPA: hypothetical protein [Caudoviricetes sp.]